MDRELQTDDRFTPGLALLCRADGSVIRVLRDEIGFLENRPLPTLTDFVHSASAEKTRRFLAELRDQRAVFGWEMNVELEGAVKPMHFAGTTTAEGLFVLVAASRSGVTKLSEDLMGINNDQTTALRSALKDLSLRQREQAERDGEYLDELSRLNNELVTTQRELARANHQLAKLNELKNHFLAMSSHDLRKPLSVILTNSELIASERTTEGQSESIRTIREATANIMRSLDDFIDIAQIESGQLKLDLEPVALADLVSRRIALLDPQAKAKDIVIQFHADVEPSLNLDRRRIAQLVDNLIENAIKYSPQQSAVAVRLWNEEHEVRLSVSDQGAGISSNSVAQLFQPFKTAGSKTTGGEKSTGLGLAIVRAIAKAHGGDVWLEQQTSGATFVLQLPQ